MSNGKNEETYTVYLESMPGSDVANLWVFHSVTENQMNKLIQMMHGVDHCIVLTMKVKERDRNVFLTSDLLSRFVVSFEQTEKEETPIH